MGAYLTYALDEGDALIHVNDVEKGAKCGCHCPHCGSPLYAKNAGKWREHHFAHAKGHECKGAYETSLHILAKEILRETGYIMLPQTTIPTRPCGATRIHNIEIEKWDNLYNIRPDAEALLDNGERLLIEFRVSHKVDEKKRQIIIDNQLNCIEIDINYQILNKETLKTFLLTSDKDRYWIDPLPPKKESKGISSNYLRNPIYSQTRDVLKEIFDEGTIVIMPFPYNNQHQKSMFDLRKIGYDTCEVNTKYRGFKCDLLLYRSQKEDKGYISINIRGRKRSEGFRYPPDLRVIDIINKLTLGYKNEEIKKILLEGGIVQRHFLSVEYYGFKNNTIHTN